jgi:hypothetical protein
LGKDDEIPMLDVVEVARLKIQLQAF